MAPTPKLTEAQVKSIRRRIRKGEQQIDLAREFGVNRKTIYRRVGDLERKEMEEAQRVAIKRRRTQSRREKEKLLERETAKAASPALGARPRVERAAHPPSPRSSDDYALWLETPKNLSSRALVETWGVRLCNPEGTIRRWVERPDVDALLEAGWTLSEV